MLNGSADPHKRKLSLGFLQRRLVFTLTIIFVALALLPIIILVSGSQNQIENQGDQQAYARLQAIADTKVDQLNDWLTDRENALLLLLSDPEEDQTVVEILTSTSGEQPTGLLNQAFGANIGQRIGFSEIFVYDAHGKIILSS